MRLFALVLFLFPFAADAAAPRLAVMPLKANRIPKETTQILDELLTNAAYRTKRFEVISTADISAVLGLEKMKDALGCSDVSCAAEIGGALGASYLLAGSVGRLGGELIISVSLIDTKQRQPPVRAQRRVKDDETLYADAIDAVISEVFGGPSSPLVPREEPPVATPRAPPRVEPTKPIVRVVSEPKKEPEKPPEPPKPGQLEITTVPAGADVTLDGKPAGKTPFTSQVPAGRHEIKLSLAGHDVETLTVKVASGDRESRAIRLTSLAERETVARGHKRRAAWAMLAIGVAMAGVAVPMFALGGSEATIKSKYYAYSAAAASSQPNADALYADVDAQIGRYRTMTPLGWAFGALAVATVPIAAALFATSAEPKATLTVSPSSAGVSMLLSGSF
ncbi:MAG: PEGA domain-containing protein [Deltaproteobacteria bacterium]|nr:PEGA domain-containing protein [Deltaproteobacteria bacterium]